VIYLSREHASLKKPDVEPKLVLDARIEEVRQIQLERKRVLLAELKEIEELQDTDTALRFLEQQDAELTALEKQVLQLLIKRLT
jgi:hypothetical protein